MKKPLGPGKIWNVKRCACKSGYVGNGITCANENNGKNESYVNIYFISMTM